MADALNRYFLAILPPEPIFSEAHQLKLHFRDEYNSKAALNSPPHITLHMPFRWKDKHENRLLESLTQFAALHHPFELALRNFDSFPPRVIYMAVEKNETLQLFQKELERFCKKTFQLFNANRLDQPYHPHLTLAFRDLKKPEYQRAWSKFQIEAYERSFTVNSFFLLKHDGKIWHSHAELLLA